MLPIDVVIPTTKRELKTAFFDQFNGCTIHLINDARQTGNANVKRNFGAKQGREEFIFFCDDDIYLKPGALVTMLETLLDNPTKGYAYCQFIGIKHPTNETFIHKASKFDRERLRSGNYISTMSLMRRKAFEDCGGFDPKINRLQDWDLWLQMLKRDIEGVFIPQVLFVADYRNDGITKATGYHEAYEIVRKKYGL